MPELDELDGLGEAETLGLLEAEFRESRPSGKVPVSGRSNAAISEVACGRRCGSCCPSRPTALSAAGLGPSPTSAGTAEHPTRGEGPTTPHAARRAQPFVWMTRQHRGPWARRTRHGWAA